MIKKLLIAVAAIAMPIGTAAAVGVVAPSVAGAAGPPPTTITCSVAGTVNFTSPGLSAGGTLTKKTVEDTASSTTASGTGCPGVANNLKIAGATTACPQTGGVPTSTDPAACLASTTVKGVTTYAIAKEPNYYDTTGSYATSGLTDLTTALSAKPIKATVDSIGVSLVFGSASEVYPGGLCGSTDVGFNVQGSAQVKGANVGTYDELVCLSNDAGSNTTGDFFADLLSSNTVISSATVGGDSSLKIVIPTITCSVAGTVNFTSPGLSAGGTLTKKTVEDTASSTTASGTGCPGVANNLKIAGATTVCPQTGGVPTSTDPAACLASTTVKGVTTYAIAKEPNYYDTTGSYATSGLTDLTAALSAKPIKATVDSIGVSLVFGSASEVYPGGLCGSTDVGFNVQGSAQVKGANVGTYDELVCLSNDAGSNTTGDFFADLLSSNTVISSATVGGDSSLTVTF